MTRRSDVLAVCGQDVRQDPVIDTATLRPHRQPVVLGRPSHHSVQGQRQAPDLLDAAFGVAAHPLLGMSVRSGQSPHVGLLGHGVREGHVRVWHWHAYG